MKHVFYLLMLIFFLAAKPASQIKLVFLGDSLTEGYNIAKEAAYPALIGKALVKEGIQIKIVNAGVSGSTTAGGLSRLNWILKGKPTHLVLALGSNDGMRGMKLEESQKNLEKIIEKCRKKGVKVLLTGQKIPLNYGKDYTKKFDQIYLNLVKKYKISFVPFLLEGVAGEPKLNLSDGIHPNEAGHKIIAENILPDIRKLIGSTK